MRSSGIVILFGTIQISVEKQRLGPPVVDDCWWVEYAHGLLNGFSAPFSFDGDKNETFTCRCNGLDRTTEWPLMKLVSGKEAHRLSIERQRIEIVSLRMRKCPSGWSRITLGLAIHEKWNDVSMDSQYLDERQSLGCCSIELPAWSIMVLVYSFVLCRCPHCFCFICSR